MDDYETQLNECSERIAELEEWHRLNQRLIKALNAENKRLWEALDKACEKIETQAKVGTSIDYANGFARGAQLQE